MARKPSARIALAALAAVAGLAALGATATPAAADSEPATSWMVHVNRADDVYAYLPNAMDVVPGAPIQLMVFGTTAHTMTSVDGVSFDVTTGENGLADFTAPLAPGEYRFYCKIHATPDTKPGEGMVGALTVVGPAAAAPHAAHDAEPETPEAPEEARGPPGHEDHTEGLHGALHRVPAPALGAAVAALGAVALLVGLVRRR